MLELREGGHDIIKLIEKYIFKYRKCPPFKSLVELKKAAENGEDEYPLTEDEIKQFRFYRGSNPGLCRLTRATFRPPD